MWGAGFSPFRDLRDHISGPRSIFLVRRFVVILVIVGILILPCTAQNTTEKDGGGITVQEPVSNATMSTPNETNATEINETVSRLVTKGIRCAYGRDYQCVVTSFDAAHEALPDDTRIIYNYAIALAYLERYDEAVGKIDTAIVLEPENPYLWYTRGAILRNAGNYTESGRSFEKAGDLDPKIGVSFFDHYPMNLILATVLKNMSIAVLLAGFCLLGIYIWFNERGR